ncbi:outer membrane beta-barrel protein [Polaribacter atrinae]|uniref:outer membrane beta-barrel protein n=1 Tax=Polaribacter atrinae TaxID=1333662 RepID=UPI002492DAF0|nr:outer membrane beta-barrel protein [Polaribacter atrinae]
MKQLITAVAAILVSTASFAQFQVSASTGYAMSSAGMQLGTTTTTTSTENNYGSYGEGSNVQIRGTYFLNEKFGLELGLGYLHGADQTITKVSVPGQEVDAVARARAFGASASMVYNFTENFYGRIGALIKVGGKTEAVVYSQSDNGNGTYSETNYIEDYHGQFPLGFVGALGYSFDLDENFSLFVEAEYYGISLKRKDSEITEFNTDIYFSDGTIAQESFYTLDNLAPGYNKETTYVDELPNNNTDTSKKLSQKVPYSSFGLNFGVTYKFSGSKK